MRVSGTFTVKDFKPVDVNRASEIITGLPVGIATMEKTFSGDISGRSITLFTAAFDRTKGSGSYVAMESFEGAVGGKAGTFNFVHHASTSGKDRSDEFFAIVAGSGTGALEGIVGVGGIVIDADGTHRMWLDIQGG